MKGMSDFLNGTQRLMLSERAVREYMSNSTFDVVNNSKGQITLLFEFAPTIQPAGSGYNGMIRFINKKFGHQDPTARKAGGKYHVIFGIDLFDIRLTYSGVVDNSAGRPDNIEDMTPGAGDDNE